MRFQAPHVETEKRQTKIKDPLTGEDQSQQTEESGTTESSANTEAENGYREFDTMLGDENTDPKDIIGYINTNIVSAGVNDVERFFKGLLSFGSDIRNIDFTELEDSRQYMPARYDRIYGPYEIRVGHAIYGHVRQREPQGHQYDTFGNA